MLKLKHINISNNSDGRHLFQVALNNGSRSGVNLLQFISHLSFAGGTYLEGNTWTSTTSCQLFEMMEDLIGEMLEMLDQYKSQLPESAEEVLGSAVETVDELLPAVSQWAKEGIELLLRKLEYELNCIKIKLIEKKREVTLDDKVQKILDLVYIIHDKI